MREREIYLLPAFVFGKQQLYCCREARFGIDLIVFMLYENAALMCFPCPRRWLRFSLRLHYRNFPFWNGKVPIRGTAVRIADDGKKLWIVTVACMILALNTVDRQAFSLVCSPDKIHSSHTNAHFVRHSKSAR